MLKTVNLRDENLARFGFRFNRGSTHLARSIMLDELRQLLQQVPNPMASPQELATAIVDGNCLGKRSNRTRQITLRHLRGLYVLDPSVPIYRVMRYFWERDTDGQPLLAFLVAYCRDSVLRSTARFVLEMPAGAKLVCNDMQEFLEASDPGRFSDETREAAAQRILASWTHTGHLSGRVPKTRSKATATPGSISLALYMGYVCGARGQTLFETEYVKLLDCAVEHAIELAETASRRGWLVCKRIGNVIEILFPNLLTKAEQEWVREQS